MVKIVRHFHLNFIKTAICKYQIIILKLDFNRFNFYLYVMEAQQIIPSNKLKDIFLWKNVSTIYNSFFAPKMIIGIISVCDELEFALKIIMYIEVNVKMCE